MQKYTVHYCYFSNCQVVCLLVNTISFVAYVVLRSGYNRMHLLLNVIKFRGVVQAKTSSIFTKFVVFLRALYLLHT